MLKARPLADLAHNSLEIAQMCDESVEPVVLTRKDRPDLVLMSRRVFESHEARHELYSLLDQAEQDVLRGDRGISLVEMRERLRS